MDTPVASARLRTFERAYTDYGALVRATLRARGVPSAAIDDVLHDVFLTAYARLGRRDPSVRLSHWLIGLARNAAFSHRRSAARRRRRHEALQIDHASPPVSADEIDARRSWEVLTRFLAELPARQREAFMLCEVAQFPASELAIVWGCTVNTVHSRLRLARARFAERFPVAKGVGDADALLEAARREVEPPPDRQRRAWAVLAAELASPWWAPLPLAKAGVAGLIAAAATIVVVVAARPPERAPEAPSPPSARADEVVASVSPVRADPPALRVAQPSAPMPTPDPIPRTRARPEAVSPAVHEAPVVDETPARDVKAETALLSRARAQLRAGASAEALRLLQTHEQTFPDGVLAIERHRLRVDVLCDLGRVDEARAAVRDLDAAAPDRVGGRTAESPCR